ncbi:MarR family transcriptional regulator [Novosphingobium sp.]|uniref:MarR family transcriptional regulator n=1 Tax=Novosphingobium sp. TaxID=1874826 RepID=UPI003D0E1CC4
MGQQDDAEEFILKATGTPHPDIALGILAQKIYSARRERDKKLHMPGLFQDPAWDILLDLFVSHTQNKYISVMSAGLAGQVPASTALRWVWALEEAKLVTREVDKKDKRRSFVFFTPEGLTYMREVLTAIGSHLQPEPDEQTLPDPATVK